MLAHKATAQPQRSSSCLKAFRSTLETPMATLHYTMQPTQAVISTSRTQLGLAPTLMLRAAMTAEQHHSFSPVKTITFLLSVIKTTISIASRNCFWRVPTETSPTRKTSKRLTILKVLDSRERRVRDSKSVTRSCAMHQGHLLES